MHGDVCERQDLLQGNSHKKDPALMVALKREFSGAVLPLVLWKHAQMFHQWL